MELLHDQLSNQPRFPGPGRPLDDHEVGLTERRHPAIEVLAENRLADGRAPSCLGGRGGARGALVCSDENVSAARIDSNAVRALARSVLELH
jgi:hypothetical protein